MKFIAVERVGARLEFRDIDNQVIGGLKVGENEAPKPRPTKSRPVLMRWRRSSYLTKQQRADEEYQSMTGIA